LRAQVREVKAEGAAASAITEFEKKAGALEGAGGGGRGGRGAVTAGPDTLSTVPGVLTSLMEMAEASEAPMTTQLSSAIAERRAAAGKLLAQWTALKSTGLASLNAELKKANLAAIEVK